MKYENILLEIRNGVAHLTLNRPNAANGMNLDLCTELDAVSRSLDENDAVRAVLISGAGKLFCAGGDLKEFATKGERELPHHLEDLVTHLHRAISRFARMRSPVIAAVHGSAAGAGMSLACACDLVVAAESARFTMAYTRAGLTPDGSGSYFLPRIIGFRRALELALLNPVLSAREANALGIVTRVVPDAELMTNATALAEEIAQGPTLAYRGVKRLMLESATSELDEQMGRETETICATSMTRDAREGIAAFLAKRPPKFTGQ